MAIRRITAHDLAERYNTTDRFWERRRWVLRRLGLLTKTGRFDFGDPEQIDRAVMAGQVEAVMSGTEGAA